MSEGGASGHGRFCGSCGAGVRSENVFCTSCGTRLGPVDVSGKRDDLLAAKEEQTRSDSYTGNVPGQAIEPGEAVRKGSREHGREVGRDPAPNRRDIGSVARQYWIGHIEYVDDGPKDVTTKGIMPESEEGDARSFFERRHLMTQALCLFTDSDAAKRYTRQMAEDVLEGEKRPYCEGAGPLDGISGFYHFLQQVDPSLKESLTHVLVDPTMQYVGFSAGDNYGGTLYTMDEFRELLIVSDPEAAMDFLHEQGYSSESFSSASPATGADTLRRLAVLATEPRPGCLIDDSSGRLTKAEVAELLLRYAGFLGADAGTLMDVCKKFVAEGRDTNDGVFDFMTIDAGGLINGALPDGLRLYNSWNEPGIYRLVEGVPPDVPLNAIHRGPEPRTQTQATQPPKAANFGPPRPSATDVPRGAERGLRTEPQRAHKTKDRQEYTYWDELQWFWDNLLGSCGVILGGTGVLFCVLALMVCAAARDTLSVDASVFSFLGWTLLISVVVTGVSAIFVDWKNRPRSMWER